MDGRQLAIEIAKDKRKTPDEMRPRGGRGGRNDNNRGHRGGDYNRDNRGGYGRGSNRDYPSRDYDRYDNRGGSYPPRDYGRRSRSRSRDYDRHNDYRARPDFRGRDDRYYPEVQILLPQLLLFYQLIFCSNEEEALHVAQSPITAVTPLITPAVDQAAAIKQENETSPATSNSATIDTKKRAQRCAFVSPNIDKPSFVCCLRSL